jgi:hypothetical protein
LRAIDQVSARLKKGSGPAVDAPQRKSFREFLERDARVPIGGGEHGPYTFEGREALLAIVDAIDRVISEGRTESTVSVAGGAQFGKTILELNLASYCTGQRFLAFGLFLPDKDLAEGIVDAKFRPDVVDQVPWFARMVQIGRAVNRSGKAVNKKGAFTVTDGRRRSLGMALGLQKIPTTFTFDIAAQDEVDDIPERTAKFVRGRMTSSALRFSLKIGTQRVAGRGMNKAWKDGSRGVVLLGPDHVNIDDLLVTGGAHGALTVSRVPERFVNPEEAFPGILRLAMDGAPSPSDPKLTWAGDFRHDGAPDQTVAAHHPDNVYYLAHPETGEPLRRNVPVWHHRRPERLAMRNESFRVSQLGIGAIGLSQIVAQFTLAANDPEEMAVFRCDVLGLPQSTAQALKPDVVSRSRTIEPFDMRMRGETGRALFAGMDVGDKCWFWVRERESASRKRAIYAASFAAADMERRAVELFGAMGLRCLLIDQRPLVTEARAIALELNGLSALGRWPAVPSGDAGLSLPGGLSWAVMNGSGRWVGLKCAVVRFDKRSIGAGIEQGFDVFEHDGQTKFVPLVRCNRFETIDAAVREFLTPVEGVSDVVDGRVRTEPAMLLPRAGLPIQSTLEEHLLVGSERAKEDDGSTGDYVDGCANHLLLADGYSALAERVGGGAGTEKFSWQRIWDRATDGRRARRGRRVFA